MKKEYINKQNKEKKREKNDEKKEMKNRKRDERRKEERQRIVSAFTISNFCLESRGKMAPKENNTRVSFQFPNPGCIFTLINI